jgi:hypothetical protein
VFEVVAVDANFGSGFGNAGGGVMGMAVVVVAAGCLTSYRCY